MKRIFEDHPHCPCLVKIDMEASEDVYAFLEEFYGKLGSKEWDKYSLADLECSYCLLRFALETAKTNRHKYGEKRIIVLTNAKNTVSEIFLDKVLNRIRLFMDYL